MKHADRQAGNILFVILLAIALFAAFSLAVTRSTNSSGPANPDQDKLDAAQIIAYGNAIKSSVDLLRNQGVSESEISFANPTVSGYGTLGTASAKEVFHIQGGGANYVAPLPRWLDGVSTAQTGYGEWVFTGSNSLHFVGTSDAVNGSCTLSSCAELVAILPYIKKEICIALNKSLGYPAGNPPRDAANTYFVKFTGTYTSSDRIADNTLASGGILPTKLNGCFEGGTSPAAGTYHYFQVLIAR